MSAKQEMGRATKEAWEVYVANPTLENARAYDEAREAELFNVKQSQPTENLRICFPCGWRHGRHGPKDAVVTASPGDCAWCGAKGVSTVPPSDFGYPELLVKVPENG